MSASVFTFSIQVGTNGYAIARSVAAKLGFQYHDWQITSEAASHAQAGNEGPFDVVKGIMDRITSAMVMEDELPGGMLPPSPAQLAGALNALSGEDLRFHIEEVVRQIARRGSAVIVGHGGQAVLRDDPEVVKVLIVGSEDKRAARLALEQDSSVYYARGVIDELDLMRRDFFYLAYGLDWLDPVLYDLTINTDVIDAKAAVEAVLAAGQRHELAARENRLHSHLKLLSRSG